MNPLLKSSAALLMLAVTPERTLEKVIRDPRLHWAGTSSIKDRFLYLPEAQLDRIAQFPNG